MSRKSQPMRKSGSSCRSTMSSAQRLPHRSLWNINSQSWPRINDLRPQDNRIHTFVQTLDMGTLFTTSTTITTSGGSVFSASANLAQFSSYSALFDQYRIDKLEVWIACPTLNSVGAGNWFTAIDYDSGATTLTAAQIQQYGNCLTSPIIQGHYHAWKPHMAVGAYSGSVFTAFKNEPSDWIDSASPTLQHFGVVAVAEATPSGAENINMSVRVTVSFRNVI